VVKVVNFEDPLKFEAAKQEFKILSKLPSHDHIAKMFSFYEDKILNRNYLVLENGGIINLEQFVRRERKNGPIKESTIKTLMS